MVRVVRRFHQCFDFPRNWCSPQVWLHAPARYRACSEKDGRKNSKDMRRAIENVKVENSRDGER
jgi:hypothetical protein